MTATRSSSVVGAGGGGDTYHESSSRNSTFTGQQELVESSLGAGSGATTHDVKCACFPWSCSRSNSESKWGDPSTYMATWGRRTCLTGGARGGVGSFSYRGSGTSRAGGDVDITIWNWCAGLPEVCATPLLPDGVRRKDAVAVWE
jgi:hypothetical protein